MERDDDLTAFLDRMGLARSGPYLAYAEYGFGWWLPYWVLHGITGGWNAVSCYRFGHEALGIIEIEGEEPVEDYICFHCGKRDVRES